MGNDILGEAAWMFSYIGLAILLVPALFAYFMDGIAQDRFGYHHPYKWGYFVGLIMIFMGLPWLYALATSPGMITSLMDSGFEPSMEFMFRVLTLYPIYIGLAGLGIVMRRRWGWILFFVGGFLLMPLATVSTFIMSVPEETGLSTETLMNVAGGLIAVSWPGWIIAGAHVLYIGGRWTEMSKQHRNDR